MILNSLFIFVLSNFFYNNTSIAAGCSPDPQQAFIDEQWRFKEAVRDVSSKANDPQTLRAAIKLSDCAQRILTQDQKLRIYKENFTDLYLVDVYPFGERKAYLQKLLEESGVAGKQYVAAADIAFSSQVSQEIQFQTLSNLDSRDAARIIFEIYNQAVNSYSSTDPNKLSIDFIRIQDLAMQFLTDPNDVLKLMSLGGFQARMPLLMEQFRNQIQGLNSKDLDARLTCSLYTTGMISLLPFFDGLQTPDKKNDFKADLIKKIKSLTEQPKFDDNDCAGTKMSKMRSYFLQSYKEKSGNWVNNEKPTKENVTIPKVPAKKIPCKIDEIRKWLNDAIQNKYRWPYTFLGGENLNPTCNVNIRIFSESVSSRSESKKKKVEKFSRYRVEVMDSNQQKLAIGLVRTDLLASQVDSQVVEWKVFEMPKTTPTAETIPVQLPPPQNPARQIR